MLTQLFINLNWNLSRIIIIDFNFKVKKECDINDVGVRMISHQNVKKHLLIFAKSKYFQTC